MTITRNIGRRSWLKGTAAAVAVVAGVGLAVPAQAADPLKIGFGMALTGGLAGAGKAALIAIQI